MENAKLEVLIRIRGFFNAFQAFMAQITTEFLSSPEVFLREDSMMIGPLSHTETIEPFCLLESAADSALELSFTKREIGLLKRIFFPTVTSPQVSSIDTSESALISPLLSVEGSGAFCILGSLKQRNDYLHRKEICKKKHLHANDLQ